MRFATGETITIPSPIDVHAHLREPGGEEKETIQSGTLAALRGGYQAVFDMPNNPSPFQTWSVVRLTEKESIAEASAHTNIGFYAGVNIKNPALGEFPGMVRQSAGLKLYMDHTTGNTEKRDLDSVRPIIDKWIVHAALQEKTPPILLHARNETGKETALYIASQGYPVHWCHVASEAEVKFARQLNRDFPNNFTAGVTPHHLTMTSRNADFQQGWHGARMQPPLGEEADAEALLDAYSKGEIKILETDHAPHTEADKMHAESENPSGDTNPDCTACYGVSGIEFVLPVMMSLVQRRKISMDRLVDSLHHQPIKMLGLKKTPGEDQSTTQLRIGPFVIREEDQVGDSGNHPYLGWTGWARVSRVAVGGVVRLNSSKFSRSGGIKILRNGSEV